jgi:hypothetical protein
MTRLFLLLLAATSAFVVLLPEGGFAGPIGGTIDLSGAFQPTKNGTVTQNMGQANGIDFLPLGTGAFTASNGTGDLAPFKGHSGTIEDFTFAPFSAVSGFLTIITVGGETLTFDLSTITINEQSAHQLDIAGTGTLHLTDSPDTAATFDFKGDSSNGASPGATFSWTGSIDPPTADVPEPSVLGTLAVALLGLAFLCRRRLTG